MDAVVQPIVNLINSIINPALLLVTAIGAVYCILLGVKFAKAEEPQEHEKAKNHMKNAIIGYVLIFVLMLALKIATPQLTTWVNKNTENIPNVELNTKTATDSKTTTDSKTATDSKTSTDNTKTTN